jgi:hypothetical protein
VAGQYDRVSANGAASLGGTLDVRLLGGFTPTSLDTFTILTAPTRSGAFVNAASTLAVEGGVFDVTYTPDAVVLSNFRVPEPSAAAGALWLIATARLRVRPRRRR